jgi:arabinofuranan 3-O-arabinosyltransferase
VTTREPPTREPTAPSASRWLGLAVLATVAYLPALTSSPGRMPADTKLYLYLDPGGLLSRASSTFEVEQFAGWVPHQQIAYLWPMGPWYWLLDTVGLPDWVAHRLWIATVMFAAGAGVRWASRLLGLGSGAALVAALVYQLSPFILAYVSRTSLLLLPWAALGWIVGLTIRSGVASASSSSGHGWRDRLTRWRDPAAIALVVATIGAVNATAVALIIPAPLLWLVHAAWRRSLTWRHATTAALRIGLLSFIVSLWWIGMLVVQSRHGAPVLDFSESLEDVSRNSTGSEVLRTLGYWLFYQRDPIGPTTSASLPYLVSVRTMLVSYLVVLVGLAGLTVVSWPQRRYAAMLIGTGIVLAVGVHPLDSPSPLMSLLTNDDGSGLALALRSSTRAVPVLLFGVALGAGALAAALPTRSVRWVRSVTPRRLAVAAIGLLAVINLPIVTERGFVDEAIDRDEVPPTYWQDAASRIDARAAGSRALQLPGAEFGSFRWGHTTDQPLVGLGSTPLVTRDLLPLGSAAAMDLLFALDDRLQEGTIEVAAVAPLARLFGVSTILLTNDMAFERYRTARPEIVDALLTGGDVAGLSNVERLGDPVVNRPDVPMIDPTSLLDDRIEQPINPLTLIEVDDAQPVIRAKSASIVLAGSGDGIVDAAASGLLDGSEAIRYSASLAPDELRQAIADAKLVIVTDSNRDRAHHWRGSQDVHGHTEPGGPDDDVLEPTAADQRLDLFGHDDPASQTIAVQEGPVRAQVSSYGEPFAYRPEDRAVMAIDGDPDTAWSVGDHGVPVGERIRLEVEQDGPPTVTLHQIPPASGGRTITSIRVTVDDDRTFDVDLEPQSVTADGQELIDPAFSSMRTLEIEITGVSEGDPAVAASRSGVGFTEIDLGRGPTTEVIRLPVDALSATGDAPLAIVLTRLRTDPTDPWRSDPEPDLVRSFSLDTARRFDAEVTLRLDPDAADSTIAALLAQASTAPTPSADRRLNGAPAAGGAAAVDGDPESAWVTPFDEVLGATLSFVTTEPLQTFDIVQRTGAFSPITMIRLASGSTTVDAPVAAPDGLGRSTIDLPTALAAGTTSLTITAIDARRTIDRRYGDVLTLPAAVAELSSPAIPRSDIDPGATIAVECADGLLHIDGEPVRLSFSTTAATLLAGEPIDAEVCNGPIPLVAGDHRVVGSNTAATGPLSAMTVDRIVLSDATDGVIHAAAAPIDVVVDRNDPRARTVTVAACPEGCWLVLGEGYNEAWRASADLGDLGAPQLLDGGFNGWLLPPSEQPATVELRWTAQAPVTWGLIVGVVSSVLLVLVIALSRRMASPLLAAPTFRGSDRGAIRGVPAAATLIVAALVLVAPIWGVVALGPAALALWAGRRPRRWPGDRPLELIGLTGSIAAVISALWIERSQRPFPDAGWTLAFDHLNGLTIFAVLALTVGAMFGSDGEPDPTM